MTVWPKRFPTEASAQPYVNNPEKLADFVYANRPGNGTAASVNGGLTGVDARLALFNAIEPMLA